MLHLKLFDIELVLLLLSPGFLAEDCDKGRING